MSDGKEVANQSAMQVQNLKQNLNEWKYVITAADAVLNTADPMKSAAAHAGLYTSVYVLFLITNVSSISPTQNRFSPHPNSPPPQIHPDFQPSILTMVSVLLAFAITADTFIGKLNDKVIFKESIQIIKFCVGFCQ